MAGAPIYIGVAWPYANGPLHLGHVAGSLLPPDIFRRYHRMAGNRVLMVSGSDCHGTPIMLQAEREGKSPEEVVERFHHDHVEALDRLRIGFDLFTRTTTENHKRWVQRVFLDALEAGFIEKRTQKAPYDAAAGRFLPDRYVEGTCPHCQFPDARGDQCDRCGKTLDPQDLGNPRSKLDPDHAIEFRDTDHFFFLLSKLQAPLERYVARTAGHWRANTINFTQNWLREGLQDRAITRDLSWGIPIPLDGYEDKRIYVWFEAVCGYLTAAVEWARRASTDDWDGVPPGAHVASAPRASDPEAWRQWWCDPKTRAYYFLGKDNIPFHTIIWPAILMAQNEARQARGEPPLVLPWDVPANEFLNLGGTQFSKSRGVGIWVHDILDRFEADAVRYYLGANMPEGRDSDWTWDDFLAKVNDELVGTLGNFVHRLLTFTQRHVGAVPPTPPGDDAFDQRAQQAVAACLDEVALHIQSVQLRSGLRRAMQLAQQGNQWMQEAQPWQLVKQDHVEASHRLHSLLRVAKGLAVALAPYLPDAASNLWRMVGEEGDVHDQPWSAGTGPLRQAAPIPEVKALFRKLEAADIPHAAPAGGTSAPSPEATNAGVQAPAAAAASKGAGRGAQKAPAPAPGAPQALATIEDFARLEIRIARVERVEPHPKADKLYIIHLDAGDLGRRQVVAGLRGHYEPDELVGRRVAFVANLQPATLRGVESQGMILAADHDGTVAVLGPERPVAAGARVR